MSHGLREHLFISFKTAWISIAQSIDLLVFRLHWQIPYHFKCNNYDLTHVLYYLNIT